MSSKKSVKFVGVSDERLDVFHPPKLLLDFEKTYTAVFSPENLASNSKIFRISSMEGLLDPKSFVVVVQGEIVVRDADGVERMVPPIERSKILLVYFLTPFSLSLPQLLVF